MPDPADLAPYIDHTLLKPEATWRQVRRVCEQAVTHRFAAVCINPVFTQGAGRELTGTGVKTGTTVGFPLGANDLTIKRSEAAVAVKAGAEEIDFVAHLPYLLAEDESGATAEFAGVVAAARDVNPAVTVKVILETAALMHEVDVDQAEARVATGCRAAIAAGCDFVKTSTGFHPTGGATVEAVRLLAKHAGDLRVKAAGGIRSRADAMTMIQAGASRLGCSAGVAIVAGATTDANY